MMRKLARRAVVASTVAVTAIGLGDISAKVTVDGPGATPGTLRMSWNDWLQRPIATVSGTLGGQKVAYSFLAP